MVRRSAAVLVLLNLAGCAAAARPEPDAAAVDVALPPPPTAPAVRERAEETPPLPPLVEPERDDERARLRSELEALDSAMLGALGSGSASGPGVPGGAGGVIGGVPVVPPAGGTVGHPGGPRGNVSTGGAGPDVPNAAPVIAAMRAGFRRCYTRALQIDPTLAGKVLMSARVDAHGEVVAVDPAKNKLPADLVACIAARISSAQFAPPTRVPAEVTIAIELRPTN